MRNRNINYPAFKVVAMYHPQWWAGAFIWLHPPGLILGWRFVLGTLQGHQSSLCFVVMLQLSWPSPRFSSPLPSTSQWWPKNPIQSPDILPIPSVKTWFPLMDTLSLCHFKQTAHSLLRGQLQGQEVHSNSSSLPLVASKNIISPPFCGIPYFPFYTGIHWIIF